MKRFLVTYVALLTLIAWAVLCVIHPLVFVYSYLAVCAVFILVILAAVAGAISGYNPLEES